MNFTLRQLTLFVEAATTESFRRTAERFGISQPSVSNHIASLERKVGARLFDRQRGSHARLTPDGERLLRKARTLLQQAAEMSERQETSDKPALRIVSGPYLADRWIRPSLRQYHAHGDMPNVEVIVADHGPTMLNMLQGDRADLAVYTGPRLDDPDIHIEKLRDVTFGLYAAPALAAKLDPQALDETPMIMAPAGSAADDWLRATLATAGISSRNVSARTQYPDVMLDLAVKAQGLAILFDDEAAEQVTLGLLTRLPFEFGPGCRWMATARQPRDPAIVAAFGFFRSWLKQPAVPKPV